MYVCINNSFEDSLTIKITNEYSNLNMDTYRF
jgi:hypothetical protein